MKYCPNCGAQLADDATFCGECGTKLEENTAAASAAASASAPVEAAAPTQSAPVSSQGAAPAVTGDKKKLIIIAAAAVAAVVILILLLTTLFGGGYKKPIKQMVKLLNSRSTDIYKFSETYEPAFAVKAMKQEQALAKKYGDKDEVKEELEDMEESFEDLYDTIADKYGKDWKIKIKITDADEVKKAVKDNAKDDLKENGEMYKNRANGIDEDYEFYGEELTKSEAKEVAQYYKDLGNKYKKAELTAGYEIDLEYTIKGKEDEDNDDLTIRVYKVNGKWVLDENTMSSIIMAIAY